MRPAPDAFYSWRFRYRILLYHIWAWGSALGLGAAMYVDVDWILVTVALSVVWFYPDNRERWGYLQHKAAIARGDHSKRDCPHCAPYWLGD